VDPFLPVPPKLYGGVERIVASLAGQLRAHGHTVGLVALAGSTAVVDFFRSWRYANPNGPLAHLGNAMVVQQACNEFSPSVVHSFSRLLYLAPLLLRQVPKIMSYGRFPGGLQIPLSAVVAGRSLRFTGCSEFIADMGRRHGGTWHAIPNFVDLKSLGFCPTVPGDAPLVFLGRIESIKGAHLAIEVAKRTGRRLILAGNHAESGPERTYWETHIAPQFGHDGIEYVGPVDDAAKSELLGTAAAMLVPIQWDEPFGIVFIESLACGTPVIACPRGALPEIVREGVDGFLVKSAEEACVAVNKIGTIDRRACRLRVEALFSASVVARQYESLYDSLL
jgi:glycosyltransferase involved in cell wall biosynthesis